MKKRIKVGIIFGGRSAEHEVSLQSAKNVFQAIDKSKYEVMLIGINKNGQWFLGDPAKYLLNEEDPKQIALGKSEREVALVPSNSSGKLLQITTSSAIAQVDVIFPVLHGTYGEDGTIQGLLKLFNLPFVGCSVLASAVGMDKDVQKRLLKEAGILTAKFLTFKRQDKVNFTKVKKQLGLPLFVKPANLGSSVGISKAKSQLDFQKAIKEAFKYDNKILIEEAVVGREIECAVLGNENPIASLPGEVKPTHEFYSYEAKYIDENGASLEIPAKLPKPVIKRVQNLAVKTFKTLNCEGMARVDFFLKENGSASPRGGQIFVNEINTIPGFTKISMYPKLWEASGIPYKKLVDKLIQLALERFKKEQKLKTSF